MRRHALPKQQTGRTETAERGIQLRLRLARDRSQQRIGKLAANRSPDLRDLFKWR
jgi:hypothetical protein